MSEPIEYREVVKIREAVGPKGGVKYVMQLSCGCLVWQTKPRKRVQCIPCWWADQERSEQLEEWQSVLHRQERARLAAPPVKSKWLIKRTEPTAGYSEIEFYPATATATGPGEGDEHLHLWPWYRSDFSILDSHIGCRVRGDRRFIILRRGVQVTCVSSMLEAISLLRNVDSHEVRIP